ncbi:MAG: type II toxin-antitoxin system VapB family antitoxin [Aestuariivirga sp.]
MAFHIRNKEIELRTRELARRAKLGLTEAVGLAVSNELERQKRAVSVWEQTSGLRENIKKRIKDPAPVSKEFRDSLYE